MFIVQIVAILVYCSVLSNIYYWKVPFFYHQNSSKKSSTFELQRVQIWNKNSCEKIFRSTFEQFNCHKQNMMDTLLFCFGKNRTFKSSSCQYIAEFLQMHLYNFSFFLFCCCCVNNYIFSAISIK